MEYAYMMKSGSSFLFINSQAKHVRCNQDSKLISSYMQFFFLNQNFMRNTSICGKMLIFSLVSITDDNTGRGIATLSPINFPYNNCVHIL